MTELDGDTLGPDDGRILGPVDGIVEGDPDVNILG